MNLVRNAVTISSLRDTDGPNCLSLNFKRFQYTIICIARPLRLQNSLIASKKNELRNRKWDHGSATLIKWTEFGCSNELRIGLPTNAFAQFIYRWPFNEHSTRSSNALNQQLTVNIDMKEMHRFHSLFIDSHFLSSFFSASKTNEHSMCA